MNMFYNCFYWIIVIAPVLSLESGTSTKCTENGDCMDNVGSNDVNKSKNGNKHATMSYYEVIDEFGNKSNISDIKMLLSTLTEKSNNYDKIQKEVEFVFQGVIVAAILFSVCVTMCIISACIYCCRMHITDHRLKRDVEALAEKLQRDCRFKKSIKKTPLPPISESCNIINSDAGIFCV